MSANRGGRISRIADEWSCPGWSVRLIVAVAALALSGPLVLAAPAPAQESEELRRRAEQALGQELTDAEIVRRLRQSGLSPAEIRDRLEARGFEPSAADPWLSVLEGERSAVPEGTDPLPILTLLARAEGPGAGRRPLGRVPAEPRAGAPPEEPEGPPVFGRDLFRRATSQFQPVTTGPVPSDYRVGPGDQLVLVLTGAVEQAYELEVSREGWVVIPDVGRVFVSGRTMEGLREALFQRLSEVYSGIGRGPDATTHFDVTVGELRTNQVYVVGEVERPAAYTVSSLATALTALYRAGGPTRNGSFRRVQVNRGGETAARIDLYDYLVRGDASRDVRLQQGDIVYVPVAERRVEITGPVARPALYGLLEGETLADLIRYAGGLQAEADLERVQIRRILPPEERRPGTHRRVLDLPVGDRPGGAESVALRDGDRVTVFPVLAETRNEVTVAGGVWRPGTYGVSEDTRLWDVIEKAGGLVPDAYRDRAQIQRLRDDRTRRLIPVSLERPGGEPVENPRIEGRDQVVVFARGDLREERVVSVGGWVREPGVYPYREGMTAADLVLQAGGLRTGAYLAEAQVSRVVVSQQRTDTLTRTFSVALDSALAFDGTTAERAPGGRPDAPSGASAASGFELRNMDAVYVRRAPGFEPQQTVVLTGEVRFPGPYSIGSRGERVLELVERAGGLTPEAYERGLQLWREVEDGDGSGTDTLTAAGIAARAAGDTARGTAAEAAADTVPEDAGPGTDPLRALDQPARRTRVGIEFARALEDPSSEANVLVEPGDSIHVPRFTPTVTVRGAVGVETTVLWEDGRGLDYYIDRAGGYGRNADEDRTRVRYANGEIETKGGGFLFFGGGVRDPDPGSTVHVPTEPEREGGGLRISEFVGILSSVATAAASVIIAVSQ